LGNLESKSSDAFDEVYGTMKELAKSLTPSELAEEAYNLYEKFCPEIPPGKKDWGASGKLDVGGIRKITRSSDSLH
jgi:hypothetical protein